MKADNSGATPETPNLTAGLGSDLHEGIDRRGFLKNVGAVGLGLTLTGGLSSLVKAAEAGAPVLGSNGKIRVAVIGTNGRGLLHVDCFSRIPGVEVAAICDVDSRAIAKGIAKASKHQKTVPLGIKDFRKVLEDKSIDAVSIATPDHWHAPMAILASAAGKHVYLEKPCSHNPYEGELLSESAKKSGRVIQMGNQRRSFPNLQQIIKEIHEGLIGKTYFARAWYANHRNEIGHGAPVAIPEWLDYELWQGPAPRRAYTSNLLHYNWHWFWNYGTGEALNNGTHEVDVCRWALGADFPVRVSSNGGRYAFQDDWETPDTQVINLDYDGGKTISWEGRSCNPFPLEKLDRGSLILGTEGAVLLDGNNYTVFDNSKKIVKQVKSGAAVEGTNTLSSTGIDLDLLHFQNFIAAIRGEAKQNSPIDEGHKSVVALQLGNIAWRVGRNLHCDPVNGHIQNDPEAAKLWKRDYEPGWEPKV